jgi:hypothetical protein
MPAPPAVGDLMPQRSPVTIVASPRPRVGKTLLARMLVDFYLQEQQPVAGFDLNAGEGTLAQFLPAQAAPASIGDVSGQMALFDRLIADDGVAKVVDLGHEYFAQFFALADQIGFVEEAGKHGIVTAILFLLTPDASSVEAYGNLRQRLPGALLAPVQSEILGAGQHRSKYPLAPGALVLRIPVMAPTLRKYVSQPPFSFVDAETDPKIPAEFKIELQHWRRRVHIECRELGLRTLLADLRSAIRIVS